MAYIRQRISLKGVKADKPETIWYSVNTCWWTHRYTDLRERKNNRPCDPRGGMLMMMPAAAFLESAEANPDHYGRHGLDAFMAAHADNCVVAEDYPIRTSLETWDEYNDLLDTMQGPTFTEMDSVFEEAQRRVSLLAEPPWQQSPATATAYALAAGQLQEELDSNPAGLSLATLQRIEAERSRVVEVEMQKLKINHGIEGPTIGDMINRVVYRGEIIAAAIATLNEALAADPDAINALMRLEVECNAALGRHPSIQVGAQWLSLTLRPLGLINGLFGADEDGWGFICMKTDADGRIVEFDWMPPRDGSMEDYDSALAEEAAARGYEDAEAEAHYRQMAAGEQQTDDF